MSLHGTYDDDNLFAKILRGEIPSVKVYEDGEVLAFMDIFPQTRGHVLVAGPVTIGAVPDWARRHLTCIAVHRNEDPEAVLARFPGRIVFIGGGPPLWDVYARYIEHWDINRLPYDGPADRWFNPAWLTAGGAHVATR